MNKTIRGAFICSLVVVAFGSLFHYYNVSPQDWGAVALWLPVYVSPIWGVAGYSVFSERSKD